MSFFSDLDSEKYDRQYSERVLFNRIRVYFKPYQNMIIGVTVMVLIMSSTYALLPLLVSRGMDMLSKVVNATLIFEITGLLLVLGFVRWGANWFRRVWIARAIAGVVMDLATDSFRAATDHDLSFYDEHSSGRILSRITSDTRDFGQLISLVTDLFSQLAEAIILGIVLVRINWKLSLYIFAIIPLVFIMAAAYRSLARKVTRKGMQAMSIVNATIKESVSGIAVAKNFRQEMGIYKEFDLANKGSYQVNVHRGLILSIVFPTLNAIGGVISAILVYSGGLTVIQGIVTAGAWYLFLLSLDSFLYPVLSLSSFMSQVQSGLSAAERVFALIDAEPAVVQTSDQPVPVLQGKIEFVDLSFRYKADEPILDHFNLNIQPGENLALVGHTGAGKSSIAKIIARFYEFQEGNLLIDGQDIRTFNLLDYRKQLGFVTQVPFLFAGTVAENIRYARDEVSDKEIMEIARQIGDGEWLETLPNGLETQVGERGAQLSMGQRQLVSLLRVLVQKPAIFILDEATASIDPFTEWQIQQALNLILKCSTSILIAHRLSTVKSADRILVMRQGKVIEEGTHDSLLSIDSHYAELYNTYFRHQSLAYVEQSRTLVEK